MKLTSIHSKRQAIAETFQQCRDRTLKFLAALDSTTFSQQVHPDFSPIGWHLGHIAFTEAYWILEQCAGGANLFPEYRKLFAADGLPKGERQNLPSLGFIAEYLIIVRQEALQYLATAPLEKEERLWLWLVQHESQHNETIALLLQLWHWQNLSLLDEDSSPIPSSFAAEMVKIPAGKFLMGSQVREAMDNEGPVQEIYLPDYYLDTYPVTCGQYRQFIQEEGYSNSSWWSEEGWQWLQANPVAKPLYWRESTAWDQRPVCGVSWYEAQAYANFVGKRLPTEAEWEKAARGGNSLYPWGKQFPNSSYCNHDHLLSQTTPVDAYPQGRSSYGCYDMLGNVWEWTATWFAAYPQFKFYPYTGYSQAYFDGQHRVLKGGSWATRPWALRASFRNWYHPQVRQILAGFRCAAD